MPNPSVERVGVVRRIRLALAPLATDGAHLNGWCFRHLELAHVGIDAWFGRGAESVRFRFLRQADRALWCQAGDLGVALLDGSAPASFPEAALATHLQRTLGEGKSAWPRWGAARPLMVIASGIPRSGTGWVKRLLRSVIQGAGQSLDAPPGAPPRDTDYSPGGPGEQRQARAALHDAIEQFERESPATCLVKTHLFAGSARTQGPAFRVLFTYRDLRDVLVSALDRMRHGAADERFADASPDALFDWLLEHWLDDSVAVLARIARTPPPPTTALVRYEHVLADPAAEVDRLARHLDVWLPADFRDALVEQHSFRREAGRDPGMARPGSYHRQGSVGGWRASLSREQQARLARRVPALDGLLAHLDGLREPS